MAHVATAVAGWARYLVTVPADQQSSDPLGAEARRHAEAATSDPRAFLAFDAVFPAELRSSERFGEAVADAYATLVADGPLAALAVAGDKTTS